MQQRNHRVVLIANIPSATVYRKGTNDALHNIPLTENETEFLADDGG